MSTSALQQQAVSCSCVMDLIAMEELCDAVMVRQDRKLNKLISAHGAVCASSGRLPAHQEAKRPPATVVMPYHARKPGRSITDPLRSIPQVTVTCKSCT